jgi:AraC-like DNA-binding protein
MPWNESEEKAIEAAIKAGRRTIIELPPPIEDWEIDLKIAQQEQFRERVKENAHDLPDDLIEHVRDMADLYSRREIAERLDVSEGTVNKILNGAKIVKSNTGRKITPAARRAIIAMKGKASVGEIASRFGLSSGAVYGVFRNADPEAVRRRKRFSEQERAKIIELRPTMTLPELARMFDRHEKSIASVCQAAGVTLDTKARAEARQAAKEAARAAKKADREARKLAAKKEARKKALYRAKIDRRNLRARLKRQAEGKQAKPRLTAEQIETILSMRGRPTIEIAKAVGACRGSVLTVFRKAGLVNVAPKVPRHDGMSNELVAKALALRGSMSLKRIGKEIGRSSTVIWRLFRQIDKAAAEVRTRRAVKPVSP